VECIESSFSDVPQYVSGDEMRVIQVIINLVYNAIKFTEKGCISLKAYCDSLHPYFITFSVADTGIGIKNSDLQRLFKPFSQLSNGKKFEGSGLGLYISKELIELMGGSFYVASKEGEGSTFQFTIPLERRVDSIAILSKAMEMKSVTDLNTLIVEDNQINRLVLQNMLQQVGVTSMEITKNGEEGLEMFCSRLKQGQPFDIV